MTIEAKALNEVPRDPGLYAMYGGLPEGWVAYVGQAGNLARRLAQHLERRDSSVTTGTSAVGLHVDYITRAVWWVHSDFSNKYRRLAAELIAFDIFNPALRSRGGISQEARDLLEDPRFVTDMKTLLRGEPAGEYRPPSLPNLADRLANIEARLKRLEGS